MRRKKPQWLDGELHVGKCGRKCVLADDKGQLVKGAYVYLQKFDELYEGAEVVTHLQRIILQTQLIGDDYEASCERAKKFPLASQINSDEMLTTGVGGSKTFTQSRFQSRSNPSRYHPFKQSEPFKRPQIVKNESPEEPTIEEVPVEADETILEKIKRENREIDNSVEGDSILARIKSETQIDENDDDTIIEQIIKGYTQKPETNQSFEATHTIQASESDNEDYTQHSMSLFSQY